MSGNLIKEINNAENEAAAIVEAAEHDAAERLRLLREEFAAAVRSLRDDFTLKKKETIETAHRDAAVAIGKERAENESELARLKNDAGHRIEKTKEYIITTILGL